LALAAAVSTRGSPLLFTGVRALPYEDLRVASVDVPEIARSWGGRCASGDGECMLLLVGRIVVAEPLGDLSVRLEVESVFPGDLPRVFSTNQCLRAESWLKSWLFLRLPGRFLMPFTPFMLGMVRRSGLVATICMCELLRRFSFGGTEGREVLRERRESLSTGGGGGVIVPPGLGDSIVMPSGSLGKSLTRIWGVLRRWLLPREVLLLPGSSTVAPVLMPPSSSTCSKVAIVEKRPEAPLRRRKSFISASLSFRFFSRLTSFLASFSISSAHHPARLSQL
jgi:hypothetical protein